MPLENPTYDVAISFLVRDESIAAEMNRLLSQGLKVFFFPHKQEELAGTNGLESMRTPFLSESRVMVVLYREPWGETPWTRVESTAIQEACLNNGWQRLFFISLDKSKPPKWLPPQFIRLNMEEFGLEQAVGAIKARVTDQGGLYQPMTPTKRAAQFKADEDYRLQLSSIRISDVIENARSLFQLIQKQCMELVAEHGLDVECHISFEQNAAEKICLLRSSRVALTVTWFQRYGNALHDAELLVREINGRMLIQSELGRMMLLTQPEVKKTTHFLPHLSRALEHGWKPKRSEDFIANPTLAEQCVMRIIELMEASNNGSLKPPETRHHTQNRASWMS